MKQLINVCHHQTELTALLAAIRNITQSAVPFLLIYVIYGTFVDIPFYFNHSAISIQQ